MYCITIKGGYTVEDLEGREDQMAYRKLVQETFTEALKNVHPELQIQVSLVHAPFVLFDPPDADPEKDTLMPKLVCPHCGHSSREGWEFLEEMTSNRSLESSGSMIDGVWTKGAEWEIGEVEPGDGEYIGLMCPECYEQASIPDSLYDWSA